jgi:hypothetical protein
MVVRAPKLTKKTAVFLIVFAAVILAAAVTALTVPADGDIGTTAGRTAYLAALGWKALPGTETRQTVVLPRKFEGVMADYNALQRSQGFDLSAYAGLPCTVYTYELADYPGAGNSVVLAQLFVYGTRVIGGDIHSTALDGFMHTLK